MEATVIGIRGQRSLIETADGHRMECLSGRQQARCCCGDQVEVEPLESGQCSLVNILPRQRLFYRADPFKKKLLAANLTQAAIVVAVEPSFSEELITRIQVAATIQQVKPLIVLNKIDLKAGYEEAVKRLSVFERLGVRVIQTSVDCSIDTLRSHLDGEVTLLMGQSGMGKSTLLNRLIPSANALTRRISEALNSGRHTTTASTLYHAPNHPILIDSPGLQQFGLYGYDKPTLEAGFIEFAPYLGRCRFDDCQHDKEPGCAITEAVKQGDIDPKRLEAFHKILLENKFERYEK